MDNRIIVIIVLLALVYFSGRPNIIPPDNKVIADQLELHSVMGLAAILGNLDDESNPSPPTTEDCQCNGTGQIDGDGNGAMYDCQCSFGDFDGKCKCKHTRGDEEVAPPAPKKETCKVCGEGCVCVNCKCTSTTMAKVKDRPTFLVPTMKEEGNKLIDFFTRPAGLTRWHLNGNFNPPRETLIRHLSSGEHDLSGTYDLENMPYQDLINLHDYDHSIGVEKTASKSTGISVPHNEQSRKFRVVLLTGEGYCAPCKRFKVNVRDKLESESFKESGWKIGVEDSNHLQVIDAWENPKELQEWSKFARGFDPTYQNTVPVLMRIVDNKIVDITMDGRYISTMDVEEFINFYEGTSNGR